MSFIHDDFLLQNEPARRLYHEFAKDLPIIDYHTHLPPNEAAENKRWKNLYEIWLAGDHYKWRAMRSNGIAEDFCTGTASDFDKYLAWARTVPNTLRNPLYHWSHLELKRYFDIDELFSEKTAGAIWEKANAKLAAPEMSAHGILKKFKVAVVCTTDDPADTLEHHIEIKKSALATKILPTYRPDRALTVDNPPVFNAWVQRLEATSGTECSSAAKLMEVLKVRHDFFHSIGCRLSDHGLERCYAVFPSDAEFAAIFDRARKGIAASAEEKEKFASHIMLHVGRWNAEKNWTMQLHLGPLRNNSTRLFRAKGPDIGCDSIGDTPQGYSMSRFLDRLDSENALPKTVLYNINPADNYLFGAMIGNFQDGSMAGKIQFGSGWWFCDQKEGMEMQINALSNLGLLSHFVGMLTDSRSFLSYPRHEYFRRIFCNLIGRDVVNGELPADYNLLGTLVGNVCYHNAARYFGFELPRL
ncbi:MAG: glucuronate isomerase [Verrucomicrobiota bacterium]|nr:glucuronate isomerase [Verrucomicrobiota bacterium]